MTDAPPLHGAELPLPHDGRGAVVTIGTFDGVHRGHREVLDEIVRRAAETDRRSVLVTFEPHPLRVIRPEHAPPLLTTPDEKKALLAEIGLDYAVVLPFTRALQQYSARRFVTEILLERLGMSELVIGYDHGFGRDREGGVETLRELGRELGFAVDVVDAVGNGGADAISSTRIRNALAEGDLGTARAGLGRPYAAQGRVVRGDQRGRELGFPTANIELDDPHKLLPMHGVYAVRAWPAGEPVDGLLHLGPRPTFASDRPTIEVYLMDWSGDLYGRNLRVEFCTRLRDVKPFESVDALVAQLRRDEAAARRIFAAGGLEGCAEM